MQTFIDPSQLEKKFGGNVPDLTTFWPPISSYNNSPDAVLSRQVSRNEKNETFGATLLNENEALKAQIAFLNQENSRLSVQSGERLKEIQYWTNKCTTLEQSLNFSPKRNTARPRIFENQSPSYERDNLNELKGKLYLLASENERLNSLLIAKHSQCSDVELMLRDIVRDKETLSVFIGERTREVEALRANIFEKAIIIDKWNERHAVFETFYINVKDSTEQLEALKKKYQEAVHRVENIGASTTDAKTILTDLEKNNEFLSAVIQKHKDSVSIVESLGQKF